MQRHIVGVARHCGIGRVGAHRHISGPGGPDETHALRDELRALHAELRTLHAKVDSIHPRTSVMWIDNILSHGKAQEALEATIRAHMPPTRAEAAQRERENEQRERANEWWASPSGQAFAAHHR